MLWRGRLVFAYQAPSLLAQLQYAVSCAVSTAIYTPPEDSAMVTPSIPSYAAFLTTVFRRGIRRDSIEVRTRTMLVVALVVSALPAFAETPTIDRGVAGIQLGMALEEVRKAFQIVERESGHIILMRKFMFGDPETRKQINKNLETQVFAMTSKLPEGASSIGLFFRKQMLYQITLHYDKTYIQKVDWDVFTLPYIGKMANLKSPLISTGYTHSRMSGKIRKHDLK